MATTNPIDQLRDHLPDVDDPRSRGLLRAYGPIAAVFLLFLGVAVMVDPVERDQTTQVGADPSSLGGTFANFGTNAGDGFGQTSGGQSTSGGAASAGGSSSGIGSTGSAAGGAGGAGAAGTDGGAATGGGGGATGQPVASGYVPAGAAPCGDRAVMIPGDPYSPPCYTFSGDNGGVTAKGVTPTEILVSVRELGGPSAAEIFASISGAQINDAPDALSDTVTALGEYFSQNLQFYGRKIKFVPYEGQGNAAEELLGGGKEKARADAVRVSKEIGAFLELNGATIPYANALAQEKVMAIGAPYPSRKWYVDRRPYVWAIFPDGTKVVESALEQSIFRLKDKPAEYAGDGTRGKPRKFAVVAPENAEYQESVNQFIKLAAERGLKIEKNIKYRLDLNTMPNQASAIIAQLKDEGITSVFAAMDPVMLAIGMIPKANEQSYFPEWLTAGLAFVDQDIVGQLMDARQWSHAFGIAYNAESEPFGGSYAYNAYKQMRPDREPAFGVEVIYYGMYIAALGFHMAGPNLTPESFEAGMFNFPGGQGPIGFVKYGPGDYTPTDDYREIWWDPDSASPQNNEPGTWRELNGGARYLPGEVATGPDKYFQ